MKEPGTSSCSAQTWTTNHDKVQNMTALFSEFTNDIEKNPLEEIRQPITVKMFH